MIYLKQPIAVGRTAEIYAWENGKVLKLFLPSIPAGWIEDEARISQYVQETNFLDVSLPEERGSLLRMVRQGLEEGKLI